MRRFLWKKETASSTSTLPIYLLLACVAAMLIATLADAPLDAAEDDDTVRVVGRLTDEGTECQALRDEDGKLYTLLGELEGFKAGDKVVVEGRVATFSMCMQGTTLNVEKIERAES